MYWLTGHKVNGGWPEGLGLKICAPSVPFYTCGTDKTFQLTLVSEDGDDLTDAYLTVMNREAHGILQAKKADENTYNVIGNLWDTSCWLGTIESGELVPIDFKISLSLGFTDGLYLPIIAVATGGEQTSDPYFGGTTDDYFGSEHSDYWGD